MLKLNPFRREDIRANRLNKENNINQLILKKNNILKLSQRAKASSAKKAIAQLIS